MGTSNAASVEQEGKYVQHNVGALGLDGNEDEYYLITETEKRLDASMSAVSFQSFEMKDKGASPVSQVWRITNVLQKPHIIMPTILLFNLPFSLLCCPFLSYHHHSILPVFPLLIPLIPLSLLPSSLFLLPSSLSLLPLLSLQHDSVVVSKVITVPGGSVVVNPTTTDDREEVGRYVAVPTNGIKPAATVNNGIGGLEKEVEEILTKSGSLVEAESHLK